MGGACGTHGIVYKALMGKPVGTNHLEDQDVDGRMEIDWGSVDWIQLAQDRDRWQAVVNTVMNLRVLEPRS
jgi:hypothetical protein